MGEGDCDSDSDCAGDLVCGTDNCQDFDSAFSSTHDCCTSGNKIIQLQVWYVKNHFVNLLLQAVMQAG